MLKAPEYLQLPWYYSRLPSELIDSLEWLKLEATLKIIQLQPLANLPLEQVA